jgi:hypothetical protein
MKVLIGFLAGAVGGILLGGLIAVQLSTDRGEVERLREENAALRKAAKDGEALAEAGGNRAEAGESGAAPEVAVRKESAVEEGSEPGSEPTQDLAAEVERLRKELALYREAIVRSRITTS